MECAGQGMSHHCGSDDFIGSGCYGGTREKDSGDVGGGDDREIVT